METSSEPTLTMLTQRQLAERLAVKKGTLEGWRKEGRGPAYIKLGRAKNASIRYRLEDVEAWERLLPRVEPIGQRLIPEKPEGSNARMLTQRQLAARLNVREYTLQWWRMKGQGPAYVKLGEASNSLIRYIISDVEAWETSLARINPIAQSVDAAYFRHLATR